ncbi:hypothetical protein EGW08_006156 [Elysia chlorotica]|uniref:Galectin domain-containing protein n=1 Tax=Elysia chlorotica TaxID=188477 RepID=A0A433TWV3_ELYCH|nr:hypothetical protein EGW08_006156 [Elysia chlorotica]
MEGVLCWVLLMVTTPLVSSDCDMIPRPVYMTGTIEGTDCVKISQMHMELAQCAFACYSTDNCTLTYRTCTDSYCDCYACQGLESLQFPIGNQSFFLRSTVIAADLSFPPYNKFALPPGGLSAGNEIKIKCRLAYDKSTFILATSNGDIALTMAFDTNALSLMRNSRVNGVFGKAETNSSCPHRAPLFDHSPAALTVPHCLFDYSPAALTVPHCLFDHSPAALTVPRCLTTVQLPSPCPAV